MKKLRPAVPECCFILIAFENKFFTAAQAITLAKILSDAADEKVRPLARGLKNPRQHCGRRRFPMRSAYDNGMLSRKKNLFQHFRQRTIRNPAIQNFF